MLRIIAKILIIGRTLFCPLITRWKTSQNRKRTAADRDGRYVDGRGWDERDRDGRDRDRRTGSEPPTSPTSLTSPSLWSWDYPTEKTQQVQMEVFANGNENVFSRLGFGEERRTYRQTTSISSPNFGFFSQSRPATLA